MVHSSAFAPFTLVMISMFGLLGVFSRYLIGLAFTRVNESFQFPFSTLFINLLGSFIIGVVYVLVTEKGMFSQELRLGIMVGLLGGFTTFSTFSLEALQLIESGRYTEAASYLILSPTLGLLLALAGAKFCRLAF
jgi:CrcB protein